MGSLFNKAAGLKVCNFFKNRLQHYFQSFLNFISFFLEKIMQCDVSLTYIFPTIPNLLNLVKYLKVTKTGEKSAKN